MYRVRDLFRGTDSCCCISWSGAAEHGWSWRYLGVGLGKLRTGLEAAAPQVPLAPGRWCRDHACTCWAGAGRQCCKADTSLTSAGCFTVLLQKTVFDCNFNREKKKKGHQCIQLIASSSANILGLLISIPFVKFRRKKKEISVNAFAEMGHCLHTLLMVRTCGQQAGCSAEWFHFVGRCWGWAWELNH